MIAIEVELLTGRYVATAYNDRTCAEWPPHPARLFSALVAAHYAEPVPSEDEREALTWLEAQEPPDIVASEAFERQLTTVFVPVNDATVVGSFDAEHAKLAELEAERAHAVKELEAATDPANRKRRDKEAKQAAKTVEDAKKRLAANIESAIRIAGKTNPRDAMKVLPEHRGRQPRTFPSVTPSSPRVLFAWREAEPSGAQRSALDRLAARVVRLGHSSSLVAVCVRDTAGEPTYRPDDAGELRLRVPTPGQLARLDEAFDRHRETHPRVMPAAFQPYTTNAPCNATRLPKSAFGDDWLVLRRVGGPSLPTVAGPSVAKTLRRVLMKYAEQPAASILSGHAEEGRPMDGAHLAIVPLPFVGSAHADGNILGVALILPSAASDDERRAVFRALAGWEAARRTADDEDAPRLPIHLGAAGELVIVRLEDAAAQQTLRASTWSAPSRRWVTATPIALDRNPGDLRARDPEKLARATREAEATIALACERIGLPLPSRITVLPAPPLAGAAKAKHFPTYPPEPGRTARVLTHASLEFATEVRGPILLGAGRYVGLGLLRPVRDA